MRKLKIRKTPSQPILGIEGMTKTELRLKYLTTYSSWRNAKYRSKRDGNWAKEFDEFSDFLKLMGPRPIGCSLDRIKNDDPRYGPGLCRWASAETQANNRSNTIMLVSSGGQMPLCDVARAEGRSPNSLRVAINRQELTEPDPRKEKPWPRPDDRQAQTDWETAYHAAGGIQALTRYEFLISRIKGRISRIEQIMDKEIAIDGYTHASSDEQLRNFRQRLADAEVANADWLTRVEIYESKIYERNLLAAKRRTSWRHQKRSDDD